MTLRARLSLGLAVVAVLLVLPQLLALRGLRTIERSMEQLRAREFAATLRLGRLLAGAEELTQLDLATVFIPDSAEPRQQLTATLDTLERTADALRRLGFGREADSARGHLAMIARTTARQRELSRAGRTAAADALSADTTRPAIAALERLARTGAAAASDQASRRVDEAGDLAADALTVSLLALAAALAVAAVVAIWLTRSISQPVHALEVGMAAVADGTFDHQLPFPPNRGDEFGRLAASYETMTAQLAELDKLKAEFVSVASHELKTPINVILGYLQLLEDNLYGDLTPKQREIIRTLTTQGHNLNRLVKHLLDISRFEAGGGRLEPRRIVLASFLRDLEDAFQVLAHQREVDLVVTHGDGLPAEVVWDPDRMNEVLGNLLSNAFKFTDRGGRVVLAAASVAGKVQLEVRDTGAGIPPEQLPRIFEKFYQADNQDAASAKGTGLGLAITKGIVEAHGGTIAVDSTPEVGTVFTIVLPPAVAQARRSAQHAAIPERTIQ